MIACTLVSAFSSAAWTTAMVEVRHILYLSKAVFVVAACKVVAHKQLTALCRTSSRLHS